MKKKNRKIKFIEKRILIGIYLFISIFMIFLKRPTVSNLEHRNLERFPRDISFANILNGNFFKSINIWFSDTVPFRDQILMLSNKMRDLNGIQTKIDLRKFELVEGFNEEIVATKSIASASVAIMEYVENQKISTFSDAEKKEDNDDKNYHMEKGIIVFEDKGKTRAVDVFAGFRNGDELYSYTLNLYKEKFPKVNIYSMIVPNSISFYCPDELKKYSAGEKVFIDNLNMFLQGIIQIPVYDVLKEHIDEDIYLRTDHHWSPLGAYYATKEFAKIAKVDFKDINTYDPYVINKFLGSFYRLTGIEKLKDVYEQFIYYTPRNANYETEQINYALDEKGEPIAKSPIKKTEFFQQFSDRNKRAYQVYMGGDNNTTHIKINGLNTGRNLLILKDSFGNPVPSYLFFSFDNIYVIDYRYFIDNIEIFINDNKISDILFVNNVQSAMRDKASKKYRKFLGINN